MPKLKSYRSFKKAEEGRFYRVLGFWCFNAGIGFKHITSLQPRSVLLTSGTLSPFPPFEAELQLKFEHKLENPHVIGDDQVSI